MTNIHDNLYGNPSPAQKQHDLRIKRVRAFRAKCLRKRALLMKKRKYHQFITMLEMNEIKTTSPIKPGYKTNIHCFFYAKKIRDAQLEAIKNFYWRPGKNRPLH